MSESEMAPVPDQGAGAAGGQSSIVSPTAFGPPAVVQLASRTMYAGAGASLVQTVAAGVTHTKMSHGWLVTVGALVMGALWGVLAKVVTTGHPRSMLAVGGLGAVAIAFFVAAIVWHAPAVVWILGGLVVMTGAAALFALMQPEAKAFVEARSGHRVY